MAIKWGPQLELGIAVIDGQHYRIAEYINTLEQAKLNHSTTEVGEVLSDLVDYAASHFAFEESLLEEAGYPYLTPHKKVHQRFTERVAEYQQRFGAGENIGEELLHMLSVWLVNHIKNDDKDYAETVRGYIARSAENANRRSWLRRWFR